MKEIWVDLDKMTYKMTYANLLMALPVPILVHSVDTSGYPLVLYSLAFHSKLSKVGDLTRLLIRVKPE